MHSGECGISLAKQIFSCPKPPAKSSMTSIFTIFLPSLIFFIFFLAIIIHLLRRNAYNKVSQEDPATSGMDRATVVPSSPEMEMTNVASAPAGTPIYTVMTNANGQSVLVPNFAPPQQIYTNNGGMPSIVYVTGDPATNYPPPLYVATSPLPPQY